jgi:hypothetical protein
MKVNMTAGSIMGDWYKICIISMANLALFILDPSRLGISIVSVWGQRPGATLR